MLSLLDLIQSAHLTYMDSFQPTKFVGQMILLGQVSFQMVQNNAIEIGI